MKWLSLCILVITSWTLFPLTVLADTSADVTVTATGYICEAPGGLTLTYVSDYEVGLSWIKGADAENTLVMAAIGRLPSSRTDGIEIYYGPDTSATAWINMETLSAPVYYRAWSQNAGGVWEETGVSDFIGGVGMILISIVVLVLGLTVAAFFIKSGMLYMVCVPAWLIFTFVAFNVNWPSENAFVPTAIAMLGIAMAILMMAVTGMHYLGNKSSEPTYDEEKAANLRKIYKLTHRKLPWED